MISLIMMCLMNIDDSYTAVVYQMLLRVIHEYKIVLSTVIYYILNSKVQIINTKGNKENSVVTLCIHLHIVCKQLAP